MEIKRHEFEKTVVWYLIDDDKRVSMLLIPADKEKDVKRPWETPNGEFDARSRYIHHWTIGSLAHVHLTHQAKYGSTMKFSEGTKKLKYKSQNVEKTKECTKIVTILTADEGYSVRHTLTKPEGYNAFIADTEFINESDRDFTIETLTAFSLDNLSPFHDDDAPNSYALHRFKGGWSLEGKHVCDDIEELGLEKSYAACLVENEKFGCIGGYPVDRYFPMAVVEDKKNNVFWAAQIAHNATWQMELSRCGDTLSLSGANGDSEFGTWTKIVKPNESYKAPSAYIGTVSTDIFEACQNVVSIGNIACEEYGEKGLPAAYNEFCSSWGAPTQEKMLSYAKALKDKGVKYVVIDAGWSEGCYGGQGGNGEWIVDKEIFPDMKGMCNQIREMGMIPGIWFEFEVTTEGSKMYGSEYDELHLKKNSVVINQAGWRTFWDFRKKEVTDYLYEKVIKFLKDNGFGYIKVDYNANLGVGCDGAESLGEGLRQHEEKVCEFFKRIKKEIPDIIIENCASGGHRLEPKMMGVSAISSFSDAHEAVEIPYIAANLNNLILPRQSLIWAVIHNDDSKQRIAYSMAATFLGRICLSGDVDTLSEEQWKLISESMDFYNACENIIVNGVSKIYGNRGRNTRYPTGTQIVVRANDNEMMAVVHSYENAGGRFEIDIPKGFKLDKEFNNNGIIESENGKLIVNEMKDFSACAVKLVK